MALPWLIGAAVVGLGVVIKKALDDDDDPSPSYHNDDEKERKQQKREAADQRNRDRLKEKISNLESELKFNFPERFAQAAQALDLPVNEQPDKTTALKLKESLNLRKALHRPGYVSGSDYTEAITKILATGKTVDSIDDVETMQEKFAANLLILESMQAYGFDLDGADKQAFTRYKQAAVRLKKYTEMKETLTQDK